MGILRNYRPKDVRNKFIFKDDLLDMAGLIYLNSKDINMTFNQYYNKYFNHEEVYKEWKKEKENTTRTIFQEVRIATDIMENSVLIGRE